MNEGVKLDALAIGAHPDDVEFSCGGTLIKLASLGYRVGVLDMARGEMGTRGTAEIRSGEAKEAAAVMGLAVRDNLELPDGHIWLTEESRVKMVRKIRQYRPRVIFTHYWEDPHPDHVHTARSCEKRLMSRASPSTTPKRARSDFAPRPSPTSCSPARSPRAL